MAKKTTKKVGGLTKAQAKKMMVLAHEYREEYGWTMSKAMKEARKEVTG